MYLLTMLCICFMCVVYGEICVDVCGVVCVGESCLFHESGCCCLLCILLQF